MTRQVIVLGVHRSGTSMIAGVLHKLGVDMGAHLLGADSSNPYGHWEDMEASKINRRILREAGGDWRHVPTEQSIAAVRMDQPIAAFIDKRETQHEVWGMKDPRLALTIRQWAAHLTNPWYIWAQRARMAAVQSVVRRNGMTYDEALSLWMLYQERICSFLDEQYVAGNVWYDWHYAVAMAHPKSAVMQLAEWLGIEPTEAAVAHIHRRPIRA